ncbi:MAG: NAD(P)H-dependent oxidoreductase [Acidobacteria bacterium]|nr:NAD(P)H-dependent oxidoreductase [Acidobacteriota bacterium]
MTEKLRILGISGSLRKGSYNTAALNAAVELCPDDAEIERYDIAGFESFNQDLEANPPAKVTEFKAKIREMDAVIFSSPEYNYSVPGVLKNAIDWASRPYGDSAWDGKPALIMGAAGGAIGTARMQYHLRQIMVFLNMHPLNRPEVMINNCVGKFDENGKLTDEKTREYLREALEALVHWTRRLRS